MSNDCNRHCYMIALAIAGLLLAPGLAPNSARGARADDTPLPDHAPGYVLVRFVDTATTHQTEIARALGATRVRTLYGSDVEVWRVPRGRELDTVARLNARRDVAYAEVDGIVTAFGTPNDPSYSTQWGLSKIGAPAAWDVATGDSALVIAVIDTGIDASHPDLASKIVAGHDFVDDDAHPNDAHGHGTHVAGVAAAITNNAQGVAGVDWQARIMPVRALNQNGTGFNSDVAEAIRWAVDHGANVINMSLGSRTYSQAIQDAVNAAHASGILVVAAMGNCRVANGSSCPEANPTSYPAAMDNVFAVAATNQGDGYAAYSQYGEHCDIAAPGGEMSGYGDSRGIMSTMPTYDVYLTTDGYNYTKSYDYMQGTSMAAPFVSGLTALVWSEARSMTPDQVQAIIEDTAVDLGNPGQDDNYGNGRINAAAALMAANARRRVTDLRVASAVTGTGALTATLQWTPQVSAMTTTVRWSAAPISDLSWPSAQPFFSPLPGNTRTCTGSLPYTGGWAYFALKTQNASGDWAPLSILTFWPSRRTLVPFVTRNG